MPEAIRSEGPDLSRRDFVKTLGAAVLTSSIVQDRGHSNPQSENAVARLYRSLTGDQKSRICFPAEHPLRSVVRPNWAIVRPTIGDLNPEQKALCGEVFKTLCSDDGHGRFLRQMAEDYGGFENYHVALFGEPDAGETVEWVLTGRHVTLRTDGVSCGGPVFYGHAPPGSREDAKNTGSVWAFQAERARALFKTLDDGQKARAGSGESGLGLGSLDDQQKGIVEGLLDSLPLPLRRFEAIDSLRLSGYRSGNPDSDPDVWRLEGPAFSWYFHGSPHVHAWLNNASRKSGT